MTADRTTACMLDPRPDAGPERQSDARSQHVLMNRALLGWSAMLGRDLAVRTRSDPWSTLVAELMSHQTQIARVGPVWEAFVRRWPTPEALSAAATDDVLRAWAGLGYNRRALALRAAARRIVADHGGAVPSDVSALERLPGVGPYTARAVAAGSFGTPVAPLDVNVRRLAARLLGRCQHDRELQRAADDLVASEDPRRWMNAIMDVAATICTRREPQCQECPLAPWCASAGTVASMAATQTARKREASGQLFAQTRRWLRGRLIGRLREAGVGIWLTFDEPLGHHSREDVQSALIALARDGFLEADGTRARLI